MIDKFVIALANKVKAGSSNQVFFWTVPPFKPYFNVHLPCQSSLSYYMLVVLIGESEYCFYEDDIEIHPFIKALQNNMSLFRLKIS